MNNEFSDCEHEQMYFCLFLLLLLFSCPQWRQLKPICPSGQLGGGGVGPQLFGCEADIVHAHPTLTI